MPVFFIILFALTLSACSFSNTPIPTNQQAMVVTANPHATQAGLQVLQRGGSAADAAVAVQAVLSLVEPQSSGLAGGAFMVYYNASTQAITAYDGRERAPQGVNEDMFINADGKPMGFIDAKTSGLSTGVPGAVAMLSLAHTQQGTLPWNTLFSHAQMLANDGFKVSERLHGMIAKFGKYIPSKSEEGPLDAFEYFFLENGEPLPVGHVLKNQAYAESLALIAQDPDNFYQGLLAEQIVDAVAQTPRPGAMTLDDLRQYRAGQAPALCQPYAKLTLCGPPPASSWVAVAMTMGIIDQLPDFSAAGPNDPDNWIRFIETQRLAYSDRDQFIADPEFVQLPLDGLLNPKYLRDRAQSITPAHAKQAIQAGNPWAYQTTPQLAAIGIDQTDDTPGTSHFVIVDKAGNVVSMTTSVESIFGSTRMAGGMFLNNQLTDFSFVAQDQQGNPIANRIAPNKRPRSSMSPTIVLDEQGDFVMATGSPGGSNIIAYTAKSLIGVLEWGLTPQEAADLPNVVARNHVVRVEANTQSESLIQALQKYGFNVDGSHGENSGLSIVYKDETGKLIGGVDKRREGTIASF